MGGGRARAGRLTFTSISPSWLRDTVKRWAADELPRRRGDGAGSVLRRLLAGVVRLSQSLRGSRPDHGEDPALLGRGDIESFLHRIGYLVSTGEASPELRVKPAEMSSGSSPGSVRSAWPGPAAPPPGWAATSPSPAATSPPNPNAANPDATCLRRSWRNHDQQTSSPREDPPTPSRVHLPLPPVSGEGAPTD